MKDDKKPMAELPIKVVDSADAGAKLIAKEIADLIISKQKAGEKAILGLATGSTPIKVYEELVRLHKEEGLSFKNVITFNLDEYYPMLPDNDCSYAWFMNHHLFSKVDIDSDNTNVPKGTLAADEVDDYCKNYDNKIAECGGIDIQLLGIGRTGHIGFNEPGSMQDSKTRLVTLNSITIKDAVREFGSEEAVPKTAITMGVDTILKSKKIILAAWGSAKAEILNEAINGEVTDQVPASFLQLHKNVTVYLDNEATKCL